jgi:hypothetical protein
MAAPKSQPSLDGPLYWSLSLASITKLNGQNWHSWSKETYLTMEEFWELIDPAEAAHDKKVYAHIWFLVELNWM